MATISFNGTISSDTQGKYSDVKDYSNRKTLKMNFDTNSFKELSKNIIINSAILTVTCSKSGGEWNKLFSFGTTSGSGLSGSYFTDSPAYNRTCNLDITNDSKLLTYLQNGGGLIASTDTSTNQQAGGRKYTYYYLRITTAKLTINYTIKNSSLTIPSTVILGNSFNYTITANSESYLHDLYVSINGGAREKIISGVKGSGQHTATANTSWANYFITPSASAQIILITKDSSGTVLGENPYSLTVKSQDIAALKPEINSFTIVISKNKPPLFSGKEWAISGNSEITVTIKAKGKFGSTINAYELIVGGRAILGNNGVFTFTAFNSGMVNFIAKITDSRGSTFSKTETRYITNYISPYITVGGNPVYRVPVTGSNEDHIEFVYTSATTSKIRPFIEGGELSNSYTILLTLDNNSFSVNQSTKKWTSSTTYGKDVSKNVIVKITDSTGVSMASTSYNFYVPSASYLLHFLNGKNAVAMGCAAEAPSSNESGRITMGWPVSFKGSASIAGGLAISGKLKLSQAHPLDVECGGTGVTTVADAQKKLEIIDLVYPVGSIYMSMNATNPKDLFGIGTWERCGVGKVPVGVSPDTQAFSTAGNSGGSMSHTLTVDEMPPHQHYPSDRDSHTITENGVVYKSQFVTVASMGSTATGRYQVGTSSSSNLWTVASKGKTDQERYGVSATGDTSSVGGGQSFSTMPPYFVCYMWKRVA